MRGGRGIRKPSPIRRGSFGVLRHFVSYGSLRMTANFAGAVKRLRRGKLLRHVRRPHPLRRSRRRRRHGRVVVAAAASSRIHRPTEGQSESGDLHRRRAQASRDARSRSPLRPSRPRQDNTRQHHRQRDGRRCPIDIRPALEKPGDLVAIITNLEAGDTLFIDEVHRLPATVEEILYSAMEDFYIDVVIGQGPAARTLKVELPHFR